MEIWQKDLVKSAFKRCYGLQDSFKKYFSGDDKGMQYWCLETLENQSGIQRKFLEKHTNEIIEL